MATSKNFVEHKNEGIWQHFLREKQGQLADANADKKYSICNLYWANRPMLIIGLIYYSCQYQLRQKTGIPGNMKCKFSNSRELKTVREWIP